MSIWRVAGSSGPDSIAYSPAEHAKSMKPAVRTQRKKGMCFMSSSPTVSLARRLQVS